MRRVASSRISAMYSVTLAVGLLLGTAGVAQAQITSREGIELQNQIQQLGQQVNQLQTNGGGNNAPQASAPPTNLPGGDLTAQLLERVSALEEQNREMRGQLDQLTNQVQQQNASLSKQISDMQFAAQNGSGGSGGSSAAPASAPAKEESAPAAAKPATAADLLQSGQAALRSRDYETAQSNAERALKSAKSTNGKMDAQFLLAQSLAGQKQYRESAVAYYDAYNRAPKSPRAQEALLGVSASMLALGDKHSACEALNKLHSEFPQPTPKVKSAMTSFKGRAGCH
ncbi:tetratricopeptide repeat protein [Kozakia baliensis]|uniref:tetratricopeptide repeat protein n=1 Tax=Kozakia baliensis TaxID=153496 RepID=UPI00087B83A7|nr:hypothetical protein A0U90_01775 [Kozakia baliensis]